MPNLVELNKRAQDSFNRLKTKLKLDLQAPLIEEGIKISEQKIQQMLDAPERIQNIEQLELNSSLNKAEKVAEFVDNSFSFIESLNLSPQLSLAIGLIISASKTRKCSELGQAVIAIQHESVNGDYIP